MGIYSEIKYWSGKSLSLFLLVLFLGYWGSITLFPHSHSVNGVTVVHSHPFKPEGTGTSSGFPHSGKELRLIQLLSEFISTVLVVSFTTLIIRSLVREIPVRSLADVYREPGGYYNYSLRAPPADLL